MAEVLVDTDIFVDHLRGAARIVVGQDVVHYCVITRAELFAGRAMEVDAIRELLAPFREIEIDRLIAERAGRLRRERHVPMADAIIAATALERELALVTRNVRDFDRIDGLMLQDRVR